jgi:serine/threonine protein kinase/tetratricopeptide (TPR) repeat protein
MDQQRWKKIKTIFNAALAVPTGERKGFVRNASDGDLELESEILRLLLSDEQAGSYLESPLVPEDVLVEPLDHPPSIQAGDVLCQRFRIDRLIGSGGMGHVFEAWDTVLRVRIGLKTIRPEIADHPASLARFRQEVLTARSLSHANICRTFGLERETRALDPIRGTEQAIIFLTMEFLEGETLADRLSRTGALTENEAFPIARQIAGALTCAHDHGIVHGDIKPANVMLVRSGGAISDPMQAPLADLRVVITDFGLARMDPLFKAREFSTAMRSMLPGGTLAYMAPEQLEGSAISSATDIYAFGLVLFEMVTGQRAFPSSNLLAGITQRVAGPPPSPEEIVPALSASWGRAIEGCLHTNPSERLKTGNQVLSALEGSRLKLSARPVPLLQRFAFGKRWKQALVYTAIFFILVALFVGILRLYQSRAGSEGAKVAPGTLVYLTQVQNRTGEQSLDNLTELIRAGLIQSAQIKPLTQDRVGDILQQMTKPSDTVIDPPIARDIALRAGAVRVIFAAVVKAKEDYVLNVDIQQLDNTPERFRNHWSRQFMWRISGSTQPSNTFPPELLAEMREASGWIRYEVGESANDIARLDVPPADVTTSNWQALAAYTKAENLIAKGQKENALIALREAVHIDPQFALAYARMGDIAVSLGRSNEGFEAYAQALGTDFDRRLTRRELDRIRGIYASDSWDYQTAESAFRDYTVYYEYDYLGWFYQALPLRRLGRTQEAIAALQKAFDLNPRLPFAPADLATCYLELGDFKSAAHWIDVLKQLNDSDDAILLEGMAAFLNGRYDDAESLFSTLRYSRLPSVQLKGLSFLANLAAERKKYTQSITWINAGITEADKQGNDTQRAAFLMDRAYIYCSSEQYAACIQDSTLSLSMDQSPELLIFASQLYGWSIAHTSGTIADGFHAALGSLAQKVPKNSGNAAYALALQYIRTESLLAKGNWKAALKEARHTAVMDQQFSRRDNLARALLLAARHEAVLPKRQALMSEAREAYAKTALRPVSIWVQPNLYPPGAFATDLHEYINLSLDLGGDDEQLRQAQQLYNALQLETPSARN